ncbi:MAG: LEVG family PEP-CTERM protein [Cyanobacteria bacterium J06636_16]
MPLTKKHMTRVGFAVPLLAASVAMTGAMTADAQAFDLVPQQEGEIALDNKACITGNCIQLDSIVKSVESLQDSSTGTQSSLFVDKYNTKNDYGAFSFRKKDVGTADTNGAYWFRPVAFNTDGSAIEGGELEVGTFKFTFAEIIETLTVSWFDTERKNGTSYIAEVETANGFVNYQNTVPKGGNNNIFTKEFSGVKSITLNLGEHYGRTGDGVNFQVDAEPVPEPSTMLGIAAAAAMGGLIRRKQKQTADA